MLLLVAAVWQQLCCYGDAALPVLEFRCGYFWMICAAAACVDRHQWLATARRRIY
jgi:hypothetical protein